MTKKISKYDLKQLRILSGKLPRTFQDGCMSVSVLGKDLITQGKTQLDTGKAIEPMKQYRLEVADKIPVNHFRRLQTVYKDGGVPRVKKYCDEIVSLHNTKYSVKFNNPFAWM